MEEVKGWLSECGYDEKVRAEAVRKEDWERLISPSLDLLDTV